MTDEVVALKSDEEGRTLDALLDFLHRESGFDFSLHKRPSVLRRIRLRVSAVGKTSLADYLDYLACHPAELAKLFDMLLINVTSFFRDPSTWDALAERLFTIVDKNANTPIRAWSAACSSGEEPYTLAMLLREALGEDAFARRVKIYATDIDEEALERARRGTYPAKALEPVPPPLVDRYFGASGDSFTIKTELRRAVVFGRHDLVHDAPIQHVDVLACRNALMYFNPDTQARILHRLRFALNPSGVLLLGKAEMLLSHGDFFSPIDLKQRLFSLASKPPSRRDERSAEPREGEACTSEQLLAASFEMGGAARMIVDERGRMVRANRDAFRLFGLSPGHTGRQLGDLALSYRPPAVVAAIDTVCRERRTVQLKEVARVLASGEKTFLDIEVSPLLAGGAFCGTQVTATDVTASRRLQVELRRAYLELEAVDHAFQATTEELRATNEQLDVAAQRLMRATEKLDAMKAELDTMSEELDVTNEELESFNEELRQRGGELHHANAFFGAVLGSVDIGIVVLDRELRVSIWNARMAALCETPASDVEGRNILELEFGFSAVEIAAALRACAFRGEESTCTLDGTTRRGKKLSCELSVLPLRGGPADGVIVLVEEGN